MTQIHFPTAGSAIPVAGRHSIRMPGWRVNVVLLAAVVCGLCSAATAQENFDRDPYPVDIVFGHAPSKDSEGFVAERAHRPRPLKSVRVEPIAIEESVPPPIMERTPPPPIPSADPAEPVEAIEPVCAAHRPSGAACCPVVGPAYCRWHTEIKPSLQATHWGYPEYFRERPFGTYARHAAQMQIANGLQNQQVLYHYDFLSGRDASLLSPRGVYQLEKIVRRMQHAPGPIIVQETVDYPELDDARRQNVLDALADMGIPAVPEMVIVGRPPVPGLQGVEGLILYENLLQQTLERGVSAGATGGTAGGGFGVGAGTSP